MRLLVISRYTNKITVTFQYAFPGNTVLHFIITHILYSKFIRRIGSFMFFSISNSKWCIRTPDFLLWLWMAYCSALQFEPPVPETLAEIKATIFYNAFCLLILRLELSHNTFTKLKISFV